MERKRLLIILPVLMVIFLCLTMLTACNFGSPGDNSGFPEGPDGPNGPHGPGIDEDLSPKVRNIEIYYEGDPFIYVGDELDFSLLHVIAYYNDGSEMELDNKKLTFSEFDITKPGKKHVTISYQGVSGEFNFEVLERPKKEVIKILIDTNNCKLDFDWGTDFNSDGLIVKKIYNYGEPEIADSTEYTIDSSKYDKNESGYYDIYVKYNLDDTLMRIYTVQVSSRPDPVPVGISVDTTEAQTTFAWNENFDSYGLVVMKTMDYGIDIEAYRSSYTVDSSAFKKGVPGTYEIIVTLNGTTYTAKYNVTVTARPPATVTSITLDTTNVTKEFYWNQEFNSNGLIVTKIMSYGDPQIAKSSEYTVDPNNYNNQISTDYYPIVKLGDQSESYCVHVNYPIAESLTATVDENYKFYNTDTKVRPDYVNVIANCKYGKFTLENHEKIFEEMNFNVVGEQNVTVSYLNHNGTKTSLSFPITINRYPFKLKTTEKWPEGTGYYVSVSGLQNKDSSSIVIPEQIIFNGWVIDEIKIDANAFKDCTSLEYITLPSSTVEIGDDAFLNTAFYNKKPDGLYYYKNWLLGIKGDQYINNVQIREDTIGIAAGALDRGCYSKLPIKTITIPASVKYIGACAFSNTEIQSVRFAPNSQLERLGSSAFWQCPYLLYAYLPKNIKIIEGRLFEDSYNLELIEIEEGSTTYVSTYNGVKSNSIIDLSTMTLIEGCRKTIIPSGVKNIGNYAFEDISGLTTITIPNTVEKIGTNAFNHSANLSNVTFQSNSKVHEIPYYCFSECTKLKTIKLPDDVRTINYSAFYNCNLLESINIPESIRVISSNAFAECSYLKSIYFGDNSQLYYFGYSVFSGCTSLTALNLPKLLKEMDYNFTSGCTSLTNLTIHPDNPYYKSENNCILSKDGKVLLIGCKSSIIPTSVETIDKGSFIDTGLESITIPENVIKIEKGAFNDKSLKTIIINSASVSNNYSPDCGLLYGASYIYIKNDLEVGSFFIDNLKKMDTSDKNGYTKFVVLKTESISVDISNVQTKFDRTESFNSNGLIVYKHMTDGTILEALESEYLVIGFSDHQIGDIGIHKVFIHLELDTSISATYEVEIIDQAPTV